jgi:multidrug efflux pump subunit AcrA (membrane-fusion protein)
MDDKKSFYRKEALQKISSPEQLDQLVNVVYPQGWLVLAGIFMLLAIAIIWSIWGRIVAFNISPCILYPVSGSPIRIAADTEGIVLQKIAAQEIFIKANDPVLQIMTQKDGKNVAVLVRAPENGKVLDYFISKGQFVAPGKPLFIFQPMQSETEALVAHAFVRAEDGKKIVPGMSTFIAMDQATPIKTGYVKGIVKSVSPYPLSQEGLMHTLQNEYLMTKMSRQGPPFEVLIELIKDPTNPPHYVWTLQSAHRHISAGALCEARIDTGHYRPIDFIF